MPMRDEFETELHHAAERDVMDIGFDDADTPEDLEMKFTLLECYTARLHERMRARRFVVERGLHDQKLQSQKAASRSAESKWAHSQYKRFQQILPPDEYERLLNGIAKEKRLQEEIERFQNYRRNGITTLVEAQEYEEELKRRDADRKKDRSTYQRKLQRKQQAPLDLTGQAGVELLTKQERKLCEDHHVLPSQYFLAKEAMIREYLTAPEQAFLTKEKARLLTDIEPGKLEKIYAFIVQSGWLNNRAHKADTSARGGQPPPTGAPAPSQYNPTQQHQPQQQQQQPAPGSAHPSAGKKRQR